MDERNFLQTSIVLGCLWYSYLLGTPPNARVRHKAF